LLAAALIALVHCVQLGQPLRRRRTQENGGSNAHRPYATPTGVA
jgi:hypothetical protein